MADLQNSSLIIDNHILMAPIRPIIDSVKYRSTTSILVTRQSDVPASRMGSPLPRNQRSVVRGLESSAVQASDTALPERRGGGSSSTTRFGGTAAAGKGRKVSDIRTEIGLGRCSRLRECCRHAGAEADLSNWEERRAGTPQPRWAG